MGVSPFTSSPKIKGCLRTQEKTSKNLKGKRWTPLGEYRRYVYKIYTTYISVIQCPWVPKNFHHFPPKKLCSHVSAPVQLSLVEDVVAKPGSRRHGTPQDPCLSQMLPWDGRNFTKPCSPWMRWPWTSPNGLVHSVRRSIYGFENGPPF